MYSQPRPLAGIPFRQLPRALKSFESLENKLPADSFRSLETLLRQSPDPDAAVVGLDRFCQAGGDCSSGRLLNAAVTLFAHSNFLTDALVRRPELLDWARDPAHFERVLSADEMRSELGWISAESDDAAAARVFAAFKRMHMLRIVLRDLLGDAELAEATLELSNLADALLQAAHDHLWRQLDSRFGRPLVPTGNGPIEGRFVVLALGKLGGRELNYSSDIDLLYLHTGEGETSGPIKIPNHEFYKQLATRLTNLLSEMTPEGFAYRVDLRLRPEGSAGDLVATVESALDYYHHRARDWELQMLIKARPAAGDLRLGEAFLGLVRPLIYRTSTDFSMIERVSESRDRIQTSLRGRRKRRIDIKLERGGIRDIEFLVQCFQRLYGGQDPFVRSGGTLFSLHRLHSKGYLGMTDYGRLNAGYQYLRSLEHRLQLEGDRQTHELPNKKEALEILERKMHGVSYSSASANGLVEQVETHFRQVAHIYERVVHSQKPTERFAAPVDRTQPEAETADNADHSWRSHLRHIEKSHPELANAIDSLQIRRGVKAFTRLLDDVISQPEILADLQAHPNLLPCVGDLIDHSPYLAEHLVRYPDDIRLLAPICGDDCDNSDQEPMEFLAALDQSPELEGLEDPTVSYNDQSMILRRFYRRQMLLLLADSVFRGRPIFSTLGRESALAEWVVRNAYRIAVEETSRTEGPRPENNPMQVIALGRLGMREFDLGSDADLVFAVPGEDSRARLWWLRCTERLIEIISSYTTEGLIFSVDPRLRPRGRDGELVQSESSFKRYFASQADAWEALSYMKARTVAGDPQRGRRFLAELQEVGWRRFGMKADLANLLGTMRARIEQETGRGSPLKGGAGGYYDVDFILLYLRLQSAGVFFEYLSTPQRVDLVRTLGGLSNDEADFLLRAATFFRSLDHAVRVVTGQSGSKLPPSRALQESISELLSRWSPIKPASQPLLSLIEDVRKDVRRLFRRVFRGA